MSAIPTMRAALICGAAFDHGNPWTLVPAMLKWLQRRGTVRIQCLADYGQGKGIGRIYAALFHRKDGGLDIEDADWCGELPAALVELVLKTDEVGARTQR